MTRGCRVLLLLAVLAMAASLVRADTESAVTRLRILVPSDAMVLIDGEPTASMGMERLFDTPALSIGKTYRYEIRVRLEGREIKKEVRFQAGRTIEIDFRPEFRKPAEGLPRRPYRPIRPQDLLPRRVYV